MKHFVICNSGRAGSKWIASVLSLLEIPTSCERAYVVHGAEEMVEVLRQWSFVGESSHLASIFMLQIPSDIVVFYQYKERKIYIEQMTKDGWFTDKLKKEGVGKQSRLLMEHFPAIKKIKRQSKRIGYIYDQFMRFAQQRADLMYNIDDLDHKILLKMLELIEAPSEYFRAELLQSALDHTPHGIDVNPDHLTIITK